MSVCIICLSTDKKLKSASILLKDFYAELCDVPIMGIIPPYHYCYECKNLLTKFYKFKQKCIRAYKLYQKWLSTESELTVDTSTIIVKEECDSKNSEENAISNSNINEKNNKFYSNNSERIGLFNVQSITINSESNRLCNSDITEDNTLHYSNNSGYNRKHSSNNTENRQLYTNTSEDNSSNNTDNIQHYTNNSEDNSSNNTDNRQHYTNNSEDYSEINAYSDTSGEDRKHSLKVEENKSHNLNSNKSEETLCNANSNITTKNIITIDLKMEVDTENIFFSDVNEDFETEELEELNEILEESGEIITKFNKDLDGNTECQIKASNPVKGQLTKTNEYLTLKTFGNIQETKRTKQNVKRKTPQKDIPNQSVKNKTKRALNVKKKTKKMSKRDVQIEKIRENDKLYESGFDIEYLTTHDLKLAEFERRKTYECYVNATFKCDICYQVFKTAKYLDYHTKKWHKESAGSVLCTICNKWNSERSSHRQTHAVVFRCKLCPLVTYNRESMQKHYEWHKGKQYHCGPCNITYKSKSSYRNHMGRAHRRGRHVCTKCGRGFTSPVGLNIHRSTSARCTGDAASTETVESVRCDECDVTLPSQEVYDVHVSNVHEGPYVVGRPLTLSSSGLPARYRESSNRDTDNRPKRSYIMKKKRRLPMHPCRLCNTEDRFTWFHLQLHFKREHPSGDFDVLYADKARHLCDVCGVGFASLYSLRDHINVHTGLRPYGCDLCQKRFRTAYLMRQHRVRHFPSTVACEQCGKTFKTSGNLYSHMKIHTGKKAHVCGVCGKAFTHSTNLKEHIRGVHNNIRRPKRGGTKATGEETGAAKGAKRRKKVTVDNELGSEDSD